MGFGLFDEEELAKKSNAQQEVGVEALHRKRCDLCTLNRGNNHYVAQKGRQPASIYVLNDSPGETEVERNDPIAGATGSTIRKRLPGEFKRDVRFGNVVQCRPRKNRDAQWQEIEACRTIVEEDIAETQPTVLVLVGNEALKWLLGNEDKSIVMWRGRVGVADVGGHACWFVPVQHPTSIMCQTKGSIVDVPDGFAFIKDWERIIDIADRKPNPHDWLEPTFPRTNIPSSKLGISFVTGSDRKRNPVERFKNELKKINEEGDSAGYLAIDIETNGIRPYKQDAKILTISIGTYDKTLAVNLDHPEVRWSRDDYQDVFETFRNFFTTESNTPWIAHNAMFEIEWLCHFFGWEAAYARKWHDTQSIQYITDERRKGQSLNDVTQQYLGFKLKDYSPVDVTRLDKEPLTDVLRYNALDVKYTGILYELMYEELQCKELDDVYETHVKRLPALTIAQLKGIPVDVDKTEEMKNYLLSKSDEIINAFKNLKCVKDFERDRGRNFNPGSQDDCVAIFRNYLNRKEIETESGPTTKNEVISEIADPFAKYLLEFRSYDKLYNSFVRPIYDQEVVFSDGYIHTNYNPTFTVTGRLSSSNPNLQNIPKRTSKWVRSFFQAPPGYIIVAIDYGQLEARVIGGASNDGGIKSRLIDQVDVHAEWAKKLAETYPKKVGGKHKLDDPDALKKLRDETKNGWTFPLFYGASLGAVSYYMNIPQDIIKKPYEEFWSEFKGVPEWHEMQFSLYKSEGYVQSATGRRRHAPVKESQLINSPIQGDASDLVVDGFQLLAYRAYKEQDYAMAPMLNVHDEIGFLLPINRVDELMSKIINTMLHPSLEWVDVPLNVEVEAGYSWDTIDGVGEYDSQIFDPDTFEFPWHKLEENA